MSVHARYIAFICNPGGVWHCIADVWMQHHPLEDLRGPTLSRTLRTSKEFTEIQVISLEMRRLTINGEVLY